MRHAELQRGHRQENGNCNTGFLIGGLIGPKIARKVPAEPFRVIVSVCGIGLAVKLGISAYR